MHPLVGILAAILAVGVATKLVQNRGGSISTVLEDIGYLFSGAIRAVVGE